MDTICIYCMAIYAPDTIVCNGCDEYKGIMPLNKETLDYLGEDLDEWKDYL